MNRNIQALIDDLLLCLDTGDHELGIELKTVQDGNALRIMDHKGRKFRVTVELDKGEA